MPFIYAEWYENHKEELAARRRLRYVNDAAYKQKTRLWNKLVRDKARKKREKEKRKEDKAAKIPADLFPWRTATFQVGEAVLRVFTIGAVAKVLGLTSQTVRNWDRRGELPNPEIKDGGRRYYTLEQVEHIYKWAQDNGRLSPVEKPVLVRSYIRLVRFADGRVEKKVLFRIGALSKALDRAPLSLWKMEKRGELPVSPLRYSHTQCRFYTQEMIEVVERVFSRGKRRNAHDSCNKILKGWGKLGVLGAEIVEETRDGNEERASFGDCGESVGALE